MGFVGGIESAAAAVSSAADPFRLMTPQECFEWEPINRNSTKNHHKVMYNSMSSIKKKKTHPRR